MVIRLKSLRKVEANELFCLVVKIGPPQGEGGWSGRVTDLRDFFEFATDLRIWAKFVEVLASLSNFNHENTSFLAFKTVKMIGTHLQNVFGFLKKSPAEHLRLSAVNNSTTMDVHISKAGLVPTKTEARVADRITERRRRISGRLSIDSGIPISNLVSKL